LPNFNLGFEYLGINFRSKVLANLTTFSTDATFTYLPRNSLALGANFVLDTKSSNLEKYDALLAWSPAEKTFLAVSHVSQNKKALDLGKFFFLVNHAATVNQIVGSEFSLDWKAKVVEARLGLSHKFNADSSGKFKINHLGYADAVLKHKINDSVTATLATGFSLKGVVAEQKVNKLPIGLGFDIKL
jgi:hypothetical protein